MRQIVAANWKKTLLHNFKKLKNMLSGSELITVTVILNVSSVRKRKGVYFKAPTLINFLICHHR